MSFLGFLLFIFNVVVTVIVVGKVGNNCGCLGKTVVAIGTYVLLKIIEILLVFLITTLFFVGVPVTIGYILQVYKKSGIIYIIIKRLNMIITVEKDLTIHMVGVTEELAQYVGQRLDNYYDANGLSDYIVSEDGDGYKIDTFWNDEKPSQEDLYNNVKQWLE